MKILFVAYIHTHFRALISQGGWLRQRGDEVGFYFAANYHGCDEDARAALKSGCRAIVFNGVESRVQSVSLWRGRREPTAFPARSFTGCLLKFHTVKQFYHDLFAKLNPDIMVLPEENIGYLSHLLIQQAHECDVRVVVMPYTIDNPVEAAEVQMKNSGCIVKGGLRRIFAQRYPQWMYEHKGVQLFRLPFPAAAAIQFMGAAPARPWQNICSFADAVAVECEALRSQHASGGVNSAKLRVTGSFALDKMAEVVRDAETLKAQLLAELELDPAKPVFLAAIPPDIFKSKQRMVEFIDHAEVVIFWIETLAATGWNVMVNLHPHLNSEVIHLGEHPNVRLCQRPVAELLPLCDVFVACISATIRWAVAAAKPVLNYDLYQYDYHDYSSAPGVVHMTTREEFSHEITRITKDDVHREQLSRAQASVAVDWGILDGGGSQRLRALFSELILTRQSLAI